MGLLDSSKDKVKGDPRPLSLLKTHFGANQLAPDAQKSIYKVKASYIKMLFYGVGTTLIAVIAAHVLNAFYPWTQTSIKLLEYTGYICWSSTLGMLGWEIQTWDGDSPAERLNQQLAKVFSMLGIFVFVMSRELVVIS